MIHSFLCSLLFIRSFTLVTVLLPLTSKELVILLLPHLQRLIYTRVAHSRFAAGRKSYIGAGVYDFSIYVKISFLREWKEKLV
jgi:hypothetical protein